MAASPTIWRLFRAAAESMIGIKYRKPMEIVGSWASAHAIITMISADTVQTVSRWDSADSRKLSSRVIVLGRTDSARHQADGYYHSVALGTLKRIFGTVAVLTAGLFVAFYVLALSELIALRWINPPTTMVQVQRRIEAGIHRRPYQKRYQFVPLGRISPNLQHAVVSAEDGRFYEHHGIDWKE